MNLSLEANYKSFEEEDGEEKEEVIDNELVREMKRLLRKNETLIAANLNAEYRKMFGKKLTLGMSRDKFLDLLSRHTLDMFYDECGILRMRRKSGQTKSPASTSSSSCSDFRQLFSQQCSLMSSDIVGINESIPMQTFPETALLKAGDFVQLYISDVQNPGHFYVQVRDAAPGLDKLMDGLDDFYTSDTEPSRYDIAHVKPGLCGMLIAAIYTNYLGRSESWHRALVTSVLNLTQIKVVYVDYGSTAVVSLRHCRFLHRQFSLLPLQGLRCHLAGLKPPTNNWSEAASVRFQAMAVATNSVGPDGGGGVVAQLMSTESPFSLVIYDAVTNYLPNGIVINQVLVDEGHAVLQKPTDAVWQLQTKLLTTPGRLSELEKESSLNNKILDENSSEDKQESWNKTYDDETVVVAAAEGCTNFACAKVEMWLSSETNYFHVWQLEDKLMTTYEQQINASNASM